MLEVEGTALDWTASAHLHSARAAGVEEKAD